MSPSYDFNQHGHLIEWPSVRPWPARPKSAAPQRCVVPPPSSPPLPRPLAPLPKPSDLTLDRSRDGLLTAFGKLTLTDRYLLVGESVQDMFARVSCAFADDVAHAQRLYDAMSRLWFMPATPVLSNGGTTRGLQISCFLNSVSDALEGIVGTWDENVWLASNGGGIGTYWGNVRSIGEKVKGGVSSGVIPFIHVMDGLTLAIKPGLVAARLGGGLSRYPASRDRGVSRDPQGVRRLQPQEPQPASRHQPHRRVHACRGRRHRVRSAQPEDERGRPRDRRATAMATHS
ncbi:hypothetical protein ACVIGA_005664 [Bradyrhizobium sp. USDA 3240]